MQFKKWFFENDENDKNAEPVKLDRAAQDYLNRYLGEVGPISREMLLPSRIGSSNNLLMNGRQISRILRFLHTKMANNDKTEQLLHQRLLPFITDNENSKKRYVFAVPENLFDDMPVSIQPAESDPSFYDADLDVDLDPKKLKYPELRERKLSKLPTEIEKFIEDFIPAYAPEGQPAYSIPDNLKLSPTTYRLPGVIIRNMLESTRNRIFNIKQIIDNPRGRTVSKNEMEMLQRYENNFENAVNKFLSDNTNINKQYRVNTLSRFSQSDLHFESLTSSPD
jgi:hypothetical protein